MSLEEIEQILLSILDILRSNGIAVRDYFSVLFFISLYKDGYFDLLNTEYEIKKEIITHLANSDRELVKEYIDIISSLEYIIYKLTDDSFRNIIKTLKQIDKNILASHFPKIFDNFLYKISQVHGRFGTDFILPLEVNRFIYSLFNLSDNAKVYNPFGGLASFGVHLKQGQYYFGQEINIETWALAKLRLMAYNRLSDSKYELNDSILNWPLDEKFDLIVSNPPFGYQLMGNYRKLYPEIRDVEEFFIRKGINSLNEKGKLVAILTEKILFSSNQIILRKELVTNDLIETIVLFSEGLLLSTHIPFIILVINKNKRLSGKIKLIDARDLVEKKDNREKILDDYALQSLINDDNNSDYQRIVSNEQILDLDYSLSIPRYFKKEFSGIELSKILKFYRGTKNTKYDTGKLIRIKDLKNDNVDYNLDITELEEINLKEMNSGIRQIEHSCLLLCTRFPSKIKPTFFKYEGTPIFLTRDIFSFTIDESEVAVSVGYLINELHSNSVKEQLESYQLGLVHPVIYIDDLLKIKINLPSIKEQIAKVEGLKELSNKIKLLQYERNELAHGNLKERFNEFASLKHTLGRPRQNILDWSDNLLHSFSSLKSECFDEINKSFADFYNMDVIGALKEIKRDINFITDVLEKGENGLILERYPKSLVSLTDINKMINEITSNNSNYKLKKLSIKGENLKQRGIECNTTLLKILIDNLLTNADKHAFQERELGNEVIIELTELDGYLIMEIKNNGEPFPKNYEKENFITKYSTANPNSSSGIGGYDIQRIAKYFGDPNWNLILNKDPIYTTIFKFRFEIKPMG